jgi:hypothetical protein
MMAKLTNTDYFSALIEIRNKLNEYLRLVDKGKIEFYKEIALKLRVLFCKKSGTQPLLKIISDNLGIEIVVGMEYSLLEAIDNGSLHKSLAEGLFFNQTNNTLSWFEKSEYEISIWEAIEKGDIQYNEDSHSYKRLIEVVADKMAAHIDSEIDDKDLILHDKSLKLLGLPPAQIAIFDIARQTIKLIDSIIDYHNNQKEYEWIHKRKQ